VGVSFQSGRPAQGGVTDRPIETFRWRFAGGSEVSGAIGPAVGAQLDALTQWRGQIDALSTTVPALASYYTGVIDVLLDAQAQITIEIAFNKVARNVRTALLIATAKESAGLERAMGATGLGGRSFPPGVYHRFGGLGATQAALLELGQIEAADASFLEELRSDASYAGVEAMRGTIRQAVGTAERPDLAAGAWFETSTEWIEHLRGVEAGLIAELSVAAEDTLRSAQNTLRLEALVIVAVGIFVATISVTLFEHLIYRIKALTKAMYRFAEGEFDIWIPGIKGRDEVGRMAAGVYAFKQETLALRKAAAEQKADDEAMIIGKAQKVVELVTEGLAALATADLTLEFNEALSEEYDSIRSDFNAATRRLRDVMQEIAGTAAELDARAGALTASSADLGARTTKQVETIRSTNQRIAQLTAEVVG